MKEMINTKRSEMKAKYEEQMRSLDILESQLLEVEETSEEYKEFSGIREETNIKQEMIEIDEREVQHVLEIREPLIKEEPKIPEISETQIKEEPRILEIGEPHIQQAPFIKQEPVMSKTVLKTEPGLNLIMQIDQAVADIPSPTLQTEPDSFYIYSDMYSKRLLTGL